MKLLYWVDGKPVECDTEDGELILFCEWGDAPEEGRFVVTDSYGDKAWWVNGELHCEDGPAIEYANGTKQWWVNGERHREDGPAVEYADGYKAWYVNGELRRIESGNDK